MTSGPEAARSHASAQALALVNRWSRRRLTDPNGVCDVSLTSYAARLDHVQIAIESIGRGRRLPRSVTLVISDIDAARGLSPAVQRLVRRGLEVRTAEDRGPHTKYVSTAADLHGRGRPLVLADDDIIYPRQWLAELEAAYQREPRSVAAHRAHRMVVENGRIVPYADWPSAICDESRADHVATGVGGVLYPPNARRLIAESSERVDDACSTTDDIWLHHVVLRAGVRVAQVRDRSCRLLPVPGLGSGALMVHNVGGGGNDDAVLAVYTADDVCLVAAASSADSQTQTTTDGAVDG